jgi:hypothetical protein
MAENAVLAEKVIDPDGDTSGIDSVLSEAWENSIKSSEEKMYKAGFEEGREEGRKEGFEDGRQAGLKEASERAYYAQFTSDQKRSIVPYADAFYNLMLLYVREEDILQHRIGLDYATGISTVLSVISKDAEDKLEQLSELAYRLAYFSYKIRGYECLFWVITDHSLDQASINHDFPFYRSKE